MDALIQQSATMVKRQFPMVERADIVQELWVWVLDHPDKVAEYEGRGRYGERQLVTALTRFGRAFAAREKAELVGYDPDDIFYYSTGQLRELLPLVMDRDSWLPSTGGTDTKITTGMDPAHGNTRLAMLCDVKASLKAGSPADKELLWTAFGLGMDDQEHALSLGVTVEALRMRIIRALRRLQRDLGGPKPPSEYMGTRRAMSNAQAQAVTRQQEGCE